MAALPVFGKGNNNYQIIIAEFYVSFVEKFLTLRDVIILAPSF